MHTQRTFYHPQHRNTVLYCVDELIIRTICFILHFKLLIIILFYKLSCKKEKPGIFILTNIDLRCLIRYYINYMAVRGDSRF